MTTNHTQENGEAAIRRQTLLQAFEIANTLARQSLTKSKITVGDVELAMGYNRESSEKLGKLRLALLGIEVE